MRTRRGLVVFIAILMLAGVTFLLAPKADAAFNLFNRPPYTSYYSNQLIDDATQYGEWVFIDSVDIPYNGISQNWDTQPMTADIFVSEMKKRLNSPTDYNQGRASGIINMMMGINADDPRFDGPDPTRWKNGVAVARANFAAWEVVVRSYDSGVGGRRVEWDSIYSGKDPFGWLGLYTDGVGDEPDLVSLEIPGAYNAEAIIFFKPDGSTFNIIKYCGKPVGEVTPLVDVIPPSPPLPPPSPTATYPTFQVNGGDVVAGSSFATDIPDPPAPVVCGAAPHNPKAGIVSWNKNGSPDYSGSGGQFAAFGNGFIQEFITSRSTNPPIALSFANDDSTGNSVNLPGGMYGGVFNVPHCVDYWGIKPKLTTVTNLMPSGVNQGQIDALPNGVYKHIGNLTINPSKLQVRTRLTIYVEGNLRITADVVGGGIVYQNTDWVDESQIQALKIIVHGSIFIDAGVTQLDGLYVAVPDTGYADVATSPNTYANPKPGTISTCGNPNIPFTTYSPVSVDTNNMINICNLQLTVNGSLVANQVWLLRTANSGPDDYTTPAEIFNYGPESWLVSPAGSTGSTYDPAYKSVVGLPPVL